MPLVTFNVKTSSVINGCTLYVVGNCVELGNWSPHLATSLTLHSFSDSGASWSAAVCIESVAQLEYRFFIGCSLCMYSACNYLTTVLSWESFDLPRHLNLLADDVVCDEVLYGYNNRDQQMKVGSGWLMKQSEIQLRICDMDLSVNDEETTSVVFKCVPVD